MITYETAVKLKEAGFPQELKDSPIWENIYWRNGSLVQGAFEECVLEEGMVKNPTLSELIEACGDKKLDLEITPIRTIARQWTRHEVECHCQTCRCESPLSFVDESGTTPEEAVAKLYLGLRK